MKNLRSIIILIPLDHSASFDPVRVHALGQMCSVNLRRVGELGPRRLFSSEESDGTGAPRQARDLLNHSRPAVFFRQNEVGGTFAVGSFKACTTKNIRAETCRDGVVSDPTIGVHNSVQLLCEATHLDPDMCHRNAATVKSLRHELCTPTVGHLLRLLQECPGHLSPDQFVVLKVWLRGIRRPGC